MSPDEGREQLNERLRALPSVDRVIQALAGSGPEKIVAGAARRAVDLARAGARKGTETPDFDAVVARARALLEEARRSVLQPVINATGVLLHTNLGRAPLGQAQLDAVTRVASTYSNLEYEVTAGSRGDRYSHASPLLQALTGAEAALVVNNNAAAVLLVLAALCRDREVIVSRGELIEIGGEFRLPDVMTTSGSRLVEVGTTNRTHLSDYRAALSETTAAIMKVHPSNYRVVGFTADVAASQLAELAHSRGVLFIHDLGSGYVGGAGTDELAEREPRVDVALEDGADLVTFSGDKLLGGPQAGIIVGRRDLIDKLAAHPLLRALRVDKMTLAALEATLALYLEGRSRELPLWEMALATGEELQHRATDLATRLSTLDPDVKVEAVPSAAVAGGGAMPGTELGSWAVSLAPEELGADRLARALRFGSIPVISRVEDDRVLIDLRCVPEDLDTTIAEMVELALRAL